ncbi:MAG: CBS domain-containing protein [bacterium]|nr:CBS domain-containing protein [bacterium]
MGDHDINVLGDEQRRAFSQALLDDLQALDRMVETGLIESGIRRIGAEQELFLINDSYEAHNVADKVLERLDGNFTPELARFNLEANASPQVLSGSCLMRMEDEIAQMVQQSRVAARGVGSRILLCGILPTLHQHELGLDAMVQEPRYLALNRILKDLRGSDFTTHIKGLDELRTTHDNVMMEACNTSFQVHFQVGAEEFPKLYNLAQVVTAPVLACAVNSPVLLQHRLWHETRVALFQQSLDARNPSQQGRGSRPRVSFGEKWVDKSVMEIFREDVSRFRVLLSSDLGESSLSMLDRGEMPSLRALCLFNGTVYRWNRPCYGVHDGVAHLRIENRVLPAGPTVVDEMAGAALFFGLMVAMGEQHKDVRDSMVFDHAKANFMAAARYGLDAQFRWINGVPVTAQRLIMDQLLPMAREGLQEKKIDGASIDRYLGVLEERVACGRTGSQWVLDSLAQMGDSGTPDERHRALTSATYARQQEGEPVHNWRLATLESRPDWRHSFKTVRQVMTRDVFTVHPEDVIDLVASLMDWEHLHRVPVEDTDGHLVGLITQRSLLRVLAKGYGRSNQKVVAVKEIMNPGPLVTVTPESSTMKAISLMRKHRVGALPVVENDRLVGIVTEHDFIGAAARLLEEALRNE